MSQTSPISIKGIPERTILWSILCFSIVSSVGGLIYGVVFSSATDAPRGGALADMVSLFMFFAVRSYGPSIHTALTQQTPQTLSEIEALPLAPGVSINLPNPPTSTSNTAIDQLQIRVDAIENIHFRDAEGQSALNWFVALSTAVGTFFWGFADIFANIFITVKAVTHCAPN